MNKSFSLKKIFNNISFSDAQIEELTIDFLIICFIALLQNSNERVNEQDSLEIKNLIIENKFEEVINNLKSKYNDEEWKELVISTIEPLLEDYKKSVIK